MDFDLILVSCDVLLFYALLGFGEALFPAQSQVTLGPERSRKVPTLILAPGTLGL